MSQQNRGPSMDRRTLIKTVGAGGAVAVGGGAVGGTRLDPVGEADAVAPIVVAGLGAAAGVGILVGAVGNHYLGEDRSDELTGSEETDDLHAELRTRLLEQYSSNAAVLTTVQNRIADARNIVWPAAKKEALKALNNGETESAAKTAAKAENDAHYRVIQENLLNRGTEWANSLSNIFDLHGSDSTLSSTPVIRANLSHHYEGKESTDYYAAPADHALQDETTTLVDGQTYTYTALAFTSNNGGSPNDAGHYHLSATGVFVDNKDGRSTGHDIESLVVDPVSTGSTANVWNKGEWSAAWSAVQNDHSQMDSNIDTFVTNLYQTTSPGDVDVSDYIDAQTLASELSTDYDSTGHYAYAAAEAAVAGIPGNIEDAMQITLEDAGITVTGTIWTEWRPYDTPTSTETATPTPTDPDPATSAFEVGQIYDPSNTNKLVLISYEYGGASWVAGSRVYIRDTQDEDGYVRDESLESASAWKSAPDGALQVGYTELAQPFTIESATNQQTGESVSVIETQSKNYQTADVSVTQEQLDQLLNFREEIRQNDSPGSGGGGAGLLGGGNSGVVIALICALGGAALVGR